MKALLILKWIDVLVQGLALMIPLVIGFVNFDCSIFLLAYFIVGGVQAISVVVNLLLPAQFRKSSRRRAEHILVYILLSLLLTFVLFMAGFAYGFCILYLLLFISPMVAVWYVWLCCNEMRKMIKIGR